MLAIFLDLEATGLDPLRHAVLEVGMRCLDLSTNKELFVYDAVVKQSHQVWHKRDAMSIEINGFTWDLVESGRDEADVGHEIVQLFTKHGIERERAVFICQNPAFDRSFFAQLVDLYTQERLRWPYHWLDLASMYFLVQWQDKMRHHAAIPERICVSKDQIASTFSLPKEERPHRALQGVDHLIRCFFALVSSPLPNKTSVG